MSRDILASVSTAAADEVVRVIGLVELDFDSTPLRVTSAPYDVTYAGDNYLGVGTLGKVEPIEESTSNQAYSLAFKLSGIEAAFVSVALTEKYQGRAANMWLALLDSDHAVIGDPVLVFAGLMDTMDIQVGRTAEITVSATSRLAKWEEPSNSRYNDAVQRRTYPNDKGFEFVEQMVEKVIQWPAS